MGFASMCKFSVSFVFVSGCFIVSQCLCVRSIVNVQVSVVCVCRFVFIYASKGLCECAGIYADSLILHWTGDSSMYPVWFKKVCLQCYPFCFFCLFAPHWNDISGFSVKWFQLNDRTDTCACDFWLFDGGRPGRSCNRLLVKHNMHVACFLLYGCNSAQLLNLQMNSHARILRTCARIHNNAVCACWPNNCLHIENCKYILPFRN